MCPWKWIEQNVRMIFFFFFFGFAAKNYFEQSMAETERVFARNREWLENGNCWHWLSLIKVKNHRPIFDRHRWSYIKIRFGNFGWIDEIVNRNWFWCDHGYSSIKNNSDQQQQPKNCPSNGEWIADFHRNWTATGGFIAALTTFDENRYICFDLLSKSETIRCNMGEEYTTNEYELDGPINKRT